MAHQNFAIQVSVLIFMFASPVYAEKMVLETLKFKGQSCGTAKSTVSSKVAAPIKETPASISIINQQRLQDQNLTSIDDVLQQVTSVTVVPNDSTQSSYYSRGYSLNSTVDSLPSIDGLSGQPQFDMAMYEQVEVLRGVAGVLNGSGDLGGTVNFVTKKPTKQFKATVETSYGSWNNNRNQIDISGSLNNDQSLKGRLVAVQQNRNFFTDKTHQNKKFIYGVLDYDISDRTQLTLAQTIQKIDTQAPYTGLPAQSTGELLDINRSTNVIPDWAYLNRTMYDSTASMQHKFENGWIFKARGRYFTQQEEFLDTYAISGLSNNLLNYARDRHARYDYTRQALDFYLSKSFNFLDHESQVVLGYNFDDYDRKGRVGRGSSTHQFVDIYNINIDKPDIEYTSGSQAKIRQTGWYGQTRLKLFDPLTLVLGARVSDYKSQTRQISPSTNTHWVQQSHETGQMTPYAGLVYEWTPQISVYGSYSNVFVPQNDITAEGEILKPREGNQYEMGIKGSFLNKRLNTSAAIFQIDDQNRSLFDNRYPNDDYYISAGKAQSRGFEAEAMGKINRNLDLSIGYSYLQTEYLKDANNQGLPVNTAEPKHSLKLWTHYTIPQGFFENIQLGMGLNAVSEYYGSRGTQLDRKQGGYTLINAMLSYPLNSHVTLALNGQNLTDKKYYATTGSINTYNTYGTPRNFNFLVKFKY